MAINLKMNHAQQLQPYMPKGSGKESGRYLSFDEITSRLNLLSKYQLPNCLPDFLYVCSENLEAHRYFIISNGFSKYTLKNKFGEKLISLNLYIDKKIGKVINFKIRNNLSLNKSEQQIFNNVLQIIRNSKLIDNTILYRGLNVSKEYIDDIKIKIKNNEFISEAALFSTSTDESIAKLYAIGEKSYSVILEISAKANTNAVGVEEVSKNEKEREVLIFAPKYRPISLETVDEKYVKIKVVLL